MLGRRRQRPCFASLRKEVHVHVRIRMIDIIISGCALGSFVRRAYDAVLCTKWAYIVHIWTYIILSVHDRHGYIH